MTNVRNNISIYYPYHPSVVGNGIFMCFFFIFGSIIAYQAISKKKYYILVMALFALAECGGYVARFIFAEEVDPLFPKYLAQIIILVLAPNFVQAFMYAILADLISWSGLQDGTMLKRYGRNLPSYFIAIDFLCLVIQGIAGATLSNPNASQKTIDNGKTTILVGLALQLGSLFVFIFVAIAFIRQLHPTESAQLYWYNTVLCCGLILVIIRNIYRVAEYTQGSSTSGSLNQHEVYFFLGDATPMALTCLLFAVQSMAYLPEKYESVKEGVEGGSNSKVIVVSPRSDSSVQMVQVNGIEQV